MDPETTTIHEQSANLNGMSTRTKIVKTSDPRPFTGPVSRAENPAAHGNIEVTETRADGKTRHVLINGRHREEGPWR